MEVLQNEAREAKMKDRAEKASDELVKVDGDEEEQSGRKVRF